MSKHKRQPGYDSSQYEILFDQPEGTIDREFVGGYTTKTTKAGKMLEVECFPRITKGNREKPEAERIRKRSTKAQDNLNEKNARKKVRRILDANFGENDIWFTATFDYGQADRERMSGKDYARALEELNLPTDDEEARRHAVNFLDRVKRLVKRRGGDPKEFKYLYVIESGKEPRDEDFHGIRKYHIHIVMSGKHLDREAVESKWPYGYANADRVQFRDNGLAGLAAYITKQRKSMRRWAGSTNLIKPVPTVSHRKVSCRRAEKVAADVRTNAKEIFEHIYPDYILVEQPEIKYSDYVPGAYIYARMRRRD